MMSDKENINVYFDPCEILVAFELNDVSIILSYQCNNGRITLRDIEINKFP